MRPAEPQNTLCGSLGRWARPGLPLPSPERGTRHPEPRVSRGQRQGPRGWSWAGHRPRHREAVRSGRLPASSPVGRPTFFQRRDPTHQGGGTLGRQYVLQTLSMPRHSGSHVSSRPGVRSAYVLCVSRLCLVTVPRYGIDLRLNIADRHWMIISDTNTSTSVFFSTLQDAVFSALTSRRTGYSTRTTRSRSRTP